MRTSRILAALLLLIAPLGAAAAEPLTIALLIDGGPGSDSFAHGARLAAAEVNAGGGIAGRPLELVELPAVAPWRDFGSLAARLIAERRPMALVGPGERAAAHLAAQIATRLRLPIVTLSTDASLTRAGDPWVFRVPPTDPGSHRELGRALVRRIAEAASAAGPTPEAIRRHLAGGPSRGGAVFFDSRGDGRPSPAARPSPTETQ